MTRPVPSLRELLMRKQIERMRNLLYRWQAVGLNLEYTDLLDDEDLIADTARLLEVRDDKTGPK